MRTWHRRQDPWRRPKRAATFVAVFGLVAGAAAYFGGMLSVRAGGWAYPVGAPRWYDAAVVWVPVPEVLVIAPYLAVARVVAVALLWAAACARLGAHHRPARALALGAVGAVTAPMATGVCCSRAAGWLLAAGIPGTRIVQAEDIVMLGLLLVAVLTLWRTRGSGERADTWKKTGRRWEAWPGAAR